jgi:hypothetical protein
VVIISLNIAVSLQNIVFADCGFDSVGVYQARLRLTAKKSADSIGN